MGLNRFECIGRIGSIKMTSMQNGGNVMELSIAVDESYKNKRGDKVEKVEWVRVKAFEKQADFIERWCRKGKLVYVQGKMQTRKWDKDGQTHYTTEIHVSAPGMGVTPLEWPDKNEQPADDDDARMAEAQRQYQAKERQAAKKTGPDFPESSENMDEVPF